MATVTVGKYVSTTEAAEIIGVSRTRVIQLLGAGELPGEKINSRAWLIVRKDAEKMANRQYTTGRPRSRVK
jgi:excisionase family DNA binding protein